MAFVWQANIQVTSLDDVIAKIKAYLMQAGWTDYSDTETKLYSSADTAGRRCYVKFFIETSASVDYLGVTIGNSQDFSDQNITKFTFYASSSTYPGNLFIYANEYWCYFYNQTNDPTAYYPSAFGLYKTKEGSSSAGEPAPIFNACPRDTAGISATYVKLNTYPGRFFWLLNGAEVEGGVLGLNNKTDSSADNLQTVPYRKRAVRAMLANANSWTGTLYYSASIPYPDLPAGSAVVNQYGTTYNYYSLANGNDNQMNLCVRIE